MNEIVLNSSLRTEQAGQLLDSLKAAKGADLRIDASKVEFLGGVCLQSLLAAAETWRADAASFAITDPSEAFIRDAATLGASSLLSLEGEEAA